MSANKLRVLALMHRHLVPPATIEEGTDITAAPWRTEYDVVSTLTAMGHECETARRAGYGSKKNGELLTLAEDVWDILLTSDRRMKYQQNMTGRKVAVVVLRAKSNRMKDLLPPMPAFAQALLSVSPGQIAEVGPL